MELFEFDAKYIEQLRNGDPATEQHFYSYFGQIMGVMLRARGLPPERVDDVRQETFVRVISSVRNGGLRNPQGFGSFVNSICKNVLRENARQGARVQQIEDSHFEKADRSVNIEDGLITREALQHVRAILGEMSQKDQDLLRAVFLEESDKDEVCRKLGVDRDYLRVRLYRAKERFRTLYEKKPSARGAAGAV